MLSLGVSVVCFDTGGASNGPTEAINGIVELCRGAASGCRNPTTDSLRMLLIAVGLEGVFNCLCIRLLFERIDA